MTSKTIVLTGEEIRADYSGGTNAWLRNDGTATVYASTAPGVTAGADGVVSIPAGQAVRIDGACRTVYLLGTGSVQLVGSDYTACPFKTSAQSGGSGADEVARAAIEAHAGNADIHVTAAEKSVWNGKADKSEIPTTLPANGGNADTVGGIPLSTGGHKGIPIINTDYGTTEIGTHIDFHTEDGQDFAGRITRETDKFIFMEPNASKSTLWADIDGSAASVGAYTEEKIAALEARIAALEGGDT